MRRLLSRSATSATFGLLLAVSACGSSGTTSASPKAELVAGMGALGDASALTTTLRLDTTPGALKAIAALGGKTLTDATAQTLASTQVVAVTRSAGKKTKAFALRAENGGKTLVELRAVAGTAYLQGDVASIFAVANQPAALAKLRAQGAKLPSFVQAFTAGKWVSFNGDVLSALAGQFGGASGGGSSGSSAGPKILADLKASLSRDVTVTRAGSGSDGDHLKLTGDAHKLTNDLSQLVSADIPGGSVVAGRFLPTNVSSGPLTLDAWVKDGALMKLAVDLAQLVPAGKVKPGQTLPLVLSFERSGGDIAAPTGATPVDLTQLGNVIGLLSGSSVSGSATATGSAGSTVSGSSG